MFIKKIQETFGERLICSKKSILDLPLNYVNTDIENFKNKKKLSSYLNRK